MPDKSDPKPRRKPFLLSAVLTSLAFPPFNLWIFAWFSLIPIIRHSRGLNYKQAFRKGWLAGFLFNLISLYWIAFNSGAEGLIPLASLLGLLLILPLYWSIFTVLWALLWKRWGDLGALLLPFIWVGLEVVKNSPEIGFPWLELGLSQANNIPIAQIAEFGGIRLVSAWVVLANVAIFFLLYKKRSFTVLTSVILSGTVLWGFWRMNHLPEPGVKVEAAIIQGNVDPEEKWRQNPDSSFTLYEKLTRDALENQTADLVIWPETAIPVYLGRQQKYSMWIQNLALEYDTAILTGAPHYEFRTNLSRGHDRYNSAFFFPADGSQPQRYDKIQLVPFGERVPFQKWIPELGELNFGQAEFTAGENHVVFSVSENVKIATQICFESVFGQQAREFVKRGANVFCNITNDGWYGRTSGPYQHAALVRFRSIETRCPLLRSANTGISLAVDRAGRIVDYLPLQNQGYLRVTVDSGGGYITFYSRYGELIPYIFAFIALLSLLISLFKRPHFKGTGVGG
ncbi:apolipoprotein N-acyltransferase [candidate division LCP-89 bacterium B3_LCP]|uniref:Apolipoprotein N-acyltransferase n=1 Tax=candidate division LCP-89 bacterium B3_LCP TaxID=2012998 RepID=A0A532V0H3_UNCL8|nr:MAG: apolipoprotein N-acyltransferase [candidate division LCP-89 bacterium B3_LCP]